VSEVDPTDPFRGLITGPELTWRPGTRPTEQPGPTLAELLEQPVPRAYAASALLAELDRLARLMHPGGTLVCPVEGCGTEFRVPAPVLVQEGVELALRADGGRSVTSLRWDGYRQVDVDGWLAAHADEHAGVDPDDPGPDGPTDDEP